MPNAKHDPKLGMTRVLGWLLGQNAFECGCYNSVFKSNGTWPLTVKLSASSVNLRLWR